MTRARGWVSLGVGILATTAGIGVGLRPILSGTWGWRGVLALVSTVIGLGLVYWGAKTIASGLDGVAAVATWVGLTILTCLLVWTLVPAVVATAVPPTSRDDIGPDVNGLDMVAVTYPGGEGVELAAWYVPPRDGATVTVRHGSGSTASSVIRHARMLVAHGFGVLLTDARGHGESTGPAMDFGWFGEDDIASSVDFLMSQPEVNVERIAILGLSMGGEEALGAIGADERIAAVVAEGASARTAADKEWLSDVYGWRGSIQVWMEMAQYSVADLLSPASPPRALVDSVAAAAPRPVLLIVAGEAPDEAHAAEHIASGSSSSRIWVVSGADHIAGLTTDPEGYEREVISFLDDALDR